jgi:hypothetical protein
MQEVRYACRASPCSSRCIDPYKCDPERSKQSPGPSGQFPTTNKVWDIGVNPKPEAIYYSLVE